MRLAALAERLRDGLLDLVFAPVCVACGDAIDTADPVRIICRRCWSRARSLPAPNCDRCWEPLVDAAGGFCATCRRLAPGVRCVRSAFLMTEPASRMVYALKYRGWEAAAAPMGLRIAATPLPPDVADEAACVVPVPISAPRLRERGYNQAELLARAFADATGRRLSDRLLIRTRATESQIVLHPDERRANVAHAFAVPGGRAREVRHEHLLLIDDVWTTGATALACAETLLDAGARAVSVLTFARAVGALRHETGSQAPTH
jgi:ComF family protein